MSEKQVIAIYDRDSKRYHRYVLDETQAIKGVLYVPKGQDIPKQVVIKLTIRER